MPLVLRYWQGTLAAREFLPFEEEKKKNPQKIRQVAELSEAGQRKEPFRTAAGVYDPG
jgi:hypothetical protein